MRVLHHLDIDEIRALHARGEFFWLDLEAPDDAEIDALAALLGMPPLAVEDSREFHQRAKVDEYGDRVLIVFYDAGGERSGEAPVEVHIHVSRTEVVTVHRRPCAALVAAHQAHARTSAQLVYRVLDALSESTLALLRRIEDEVSGIEQRAFERPSAADRRRITELRGRLFRLLQVVEPQRDMLATSAGDIERVLGTEPGEVQHPFRDVHDDLVLAVNLIAYCRELLAEALNVYLQTTSNRLNEIATRLTLLATIFVPLTLITSYFGQNFGWLVNHIDSLRAFLLWGVGALVVPVVVIGVWLRRAGYLNGDGQ
jgi:magnesium transporter